MIHFIQTRLKYLNDGTVEKIVFCTVFFSAVQNRICDFLYFYALPSLKEMMITVRYHRRKSLTKTVSDSVFTPLQHISETRGDLNYKYPFNQVRVVLISKYS